jgi:hypothetical protein
MIFKFRKINLLSVSSLMPIGCTKRQFHTTLFLSNQALGGLKAQVQNIPTIEELRRKLSAQKNATEFKKEMNNPDRIIGRAYAELEEERKYEFENC